METAPQLEEAGRPDDSPRTLGDVLYGRKPRHVVPETDWIALVRAVAARDQAALQGLYERSHRLVFTLTFRMTHSRETAEELTLDVFHDVWRRAARYDAAQGTVLAWIMNQARSRAIDRLRFESRKKRFQPNGEDVAAEGEAPDSRELVELQQRGLLLREALNALTPEERLAIEAAFFSGLTYAEVAVRLHQPLGTIKTRIRSALQKLRQALAAEGRSS
ncbi:MAG TPA: sigma-70 family RNA polymerase sigma factor [Burkholderiales bacterium]|nr:sigma-70 family RNA polymerase sigma factor [Burkholderiales bacterium]